MSKMLDAQKRSQGNRTTAIVIVVSSVVFLCGVVGFGVWSIATGEASPLWLLVPIAAVMMYVTRVL